MQQSGVGEGERVEENNDKRITCLEHSLGLLENEVYNQKELITELRKSLKEIDELKLTMQALISQISGAKWALAILISLGTFFTIVLWNVLDHWDKMLK